MDENSIFYSAALYAMDDGLDMSRKGTIDVVQAATDYKPGDRMCKDVYPALAKMAGRDPKDWGAIERRMRAAVRDAWRRRGLDGCPTTGQYIASLSLRVRHA